MLMLMWYWVLVLVMEVVGVGCWLGGRHHHAPRLACNLLLVMWQLESPEAEGGAIVFVSVLRLFFVGSWWSILPAAKAIDPPHPFQLKDDDSLRLRP